MKKQDYNCEITANVNTEEAINGISHVWAWWAKDYKGTSEKINDTFTVRFGETFVDFKLSEVVPDKKVVWHVTDCFLHWQNDKTEWNSTDIVWEVTEKNNTTAIKMTHVGLTPDVECYDNCKNGWDGHIKGSLLKLLNEGTGTPQ